MFVISMADFHCKKSFSINNKLQQPQAAHGVLVYAMKNHGADVVSNTPLLELHDLLIHCFFLQTCDT